MTRNALKNALALVIGTMLFALTVHSQTGTPRAFSTDDSGNRWKITYLLDTTIEQADFVSVVILDATSGAVIKVDDYSFSKGDVAREIDGVHLPSLALDKSRTYFLVFSIRKKANNKFSVESFTTPQMEFVDLFVKPTQPANGYVRKRAEAKGKEDADVYVAGEWGGTKGTTARYSIDLKIEPTFTNGRWYYTPVFFNLNASTDPEADPDHMTFGAKGGYIFPFEVKESPNWKFRLTGLNTSFGGKIESEKDFDNTNLLFDSKLNFVVTTIPLGKSATLTFDPYIGTELGKNLRSPLAAAEGNGIARMLAGASAVLDVPINHSPLKGIVWETSYTRRWLLTNELAYETGDDDQPVLVEFGKSPRDYVVSKVEFKINRFLNPYVSYEWGEVPPSYKLVDHRYKVGFAYQFTLSPK